jgi:hypothetical protein
MEDPEEMEPTVAPQDDDYYEEALDAAHQSDEDEEAVEEFNSETEDDEPEVRIWLLRFTHQGNEERKGEKRVRGSQRKGQGGVSNEKKIWM